MTLKEMNAKISAFQKVMEVIETKIAEENGYKRVKAYGTLDDSVYFRIEKETEDGPELYHILKDNNFVVRPITEEEKEMIQKC